MIVLTKLNGAEFALNPDLIETIAEKPDTTIKLTTGTTYIASERMDDIIDAIIAYRRRIYGNLFYTDSR